MPAITRFIAAAVMVAATAISAHAQSVLADRIQAGDRRAALELVAKGVDVNQAQPDGTTPLHWAVYKIDRELVQTLLRRGARATRPIAMVHVLWPKPSGWPTSNWSRCCSRREPMPTAPTRTDRRR